MFPTPVWYERTDSPGWEISDWETANKLLSYVEPEYRPYAIFSLPDKSYVQCLGSKRRLTVEARIYEPNGSFTHWVLGKGRLTGSPEVIEVCTGRVNVGASQLLSMRDARVIIQQFLRTRTLPLTYQTHDITSRFAQSPIN